MNKDLKSIIENSVILTILNDLSEYVYITDEEGYVRFINRAAEKFEHQSNDEIIGKHINDIYTQKESPTLKALQTRRPVEEHENLYMFNGKQYNQLAKSLPLFSGERLIGACTIQRDMTLVTQILSDNASLQKNQRKNSKTSSKTFASLIGEHPDFLRSIQLAKAASGNDSSVLLSGFTGSGKEVFANAIHNASARKDKAFLAINCATVPEGLLESILFGTTKGTFTGSLDKTGLFEQAEGGTLFLDEINSMSLSSQAKLLRVLEEKEIRKLDGDTDIKIDVRIISSINTTPSIALQKGQLREDLFYRLSVNTVIIPPLKDRYGDIKLLTEHFIRKFNLKFNKNIKELSPQVSDFFKSYSWPGNVRQLKHVIESAINVTSQGEEEIRLSHMPHYLFESQTTSYVETFSRMKTPDFDEGLPKEPFKTESERSASYAENLAERPVKNMYQKSLSGSELSEEELQDMRFSEKNPFTFSPGSIDGHDLYADEPHPPTDRRNSPASRQNTSDERQTGFANLTDRRKSDAVSHMANTDNQDTNAAAHAPNTKLQSASTAGQHLTAGSRGLSAENLYSAIRENEKNQIMQALIDCNGNVSKTARTLNMNRQSLVYRMKKYNIKR